MISIYIWMYWQGGFAAGLARRQSTSRVVIMQGNRPYRSTNYLAEAPNRSSACLSTCPSFVIHTSCFKRSRRLSEKHARDSPLSFYSATRYLRLQNRCAVSSKKYNVSNVHAAFVRRHSFSAWKHITLPLALLRRCFVVFLFVCLLFLHPIYFPRPTFSLPRSSNSDPGSVSVQSSTLPAIYLTGFAHDFNT